MQVKSKYKQMCLMAMRETDRQTDRQTGRQTYRERERADRDVCIEEDRQIDIFVVRQIIQKTGY